MMTLTQDLADLAGRKDGEKVGDARTGCEHSPFACAELGNLLDRHVRLAGQGLDGALVRSAVVGMRRRGKQSHGVAFGSCTSSLRLIPPPSTSGKMASHHPTMRGHGHDSAPYLLPTREPGTPVALHHPSLPLAKSRRVVSPQPRADPLPPKFQRQRRQQRLGLLQVGGVKALSEPAVGRRQQLAGRSALALTLPQASQARGGP
jgi:hypothetical protein